MTLDYRFPDTGAPRAQEVAAILTREEALDWIAFAMKLILGVPLSCVPPAILAYLIVSKKTLPWSYLPPIAICIWVIFLPLGIWLSWRRRQELNWQSPSGTWIGPVGIYTVPVLIGPKLVLSLLEQLTVEEPNSAVRAQAAAIVIQLLDARQSMSTRSLLSDGQRTPEEVTHAVKYLERYDWVKIPRTRDRVWLTDSIRKELAHLQ